MYVLRIFHNVNSESPFTFYLTPSSVHTPREYNATILNTEPVGEEILMVAARDSDSGSYGSVTYRLRSGNSEGLFAINSRTGLITVAGSLAASRGKETLQ
jgi:protocadherin Fat 4